jgi:tRNA:m4X modification enzyme
MDLISATRALVSDPSDGCYEVAAARGHGACCSTQSGLSLEAAQTRETLRLAQLVAGQCTWWLAKKQRYCKNESGTRDAVFCGVHRSPAGSGAITGRVACPIDPSHTVWTRDLNAHVRKCNIVSVARVAESQSFFCRDLNSGPSQIPVAFPQNPTTSRVHTNATNARAATDIDPDPDLNAAPAALWANVARFSEWIHDLIVALDELERETPTKPPTAVFAAETVPSAAVLSQGQAATTLSSERHLSQQASIVGHMEAAGLLDGPCVDGSRPAVGTTFVEFGAARGGLSLGIDAALQGKRGLASDGPANIDAHRTCFVLVDRMRIRKKAEKAMRAQGSTSRDTNGDASPEVPARGEIDAKRPSCLRLKVDIRHLRLRQVDGVGGNVGGTVVAYSKHLCGVATDLALRCLRNFLVDLSHDGAGGEVAGVAIALCCHTLCEHRDFVGNRLLSAVFDLADRRLRSQSGSGDRQGDTTFTHYGRKQFEAIKHASGWTTTFRSRSTGLSVEDAAARVRVGRNCKRLLDAGRLDYTQRELGLCGHLVTYCDETVSPENTLLLAWLPPTIDVAPKVS